MKSYFKHKSRIYPFPVVIRATGRVDVLKVEGDQLSSLQKAVGGYIELVGVPADPDLVLVVDEEGRLKDKPVNMVASEIALQPLVGDMVMMERKQLD